MRSKFGLDADEVIACAFQLALDETRGWFGVLVKQYQIDDPA